MFKVYFYYYISTGIVSCNSFFLQILAKHVSLSSLLNVIAKRMWGEPPAKRGAVMIEMGTYLQADLDMIM